MALVSLLLGGCGAGDKSPTFRTTDITGADFGKDFHLIDHNGQSRQLADFRGKAVVVFFGFTHCPDACPTTLAEIAGALKQLGPGADRVQVLMVTVDPERDTPEILKQYVTALDPHFLGLTGDAEAMPVLCRPEGCFPCHCGFHPAPLSRIEAPVVFPCIRS